jgi:hypothetical protein
MPGELRDKLKLWEAINTILKKGVAIDDIHAKINELWGKMDVDADGSIKIGEGAENDKENCENTIAIGSGSSNTALPIIPNNGSLSNIGHGNNSIAIGVGASTTSADSVAIGPHAHATQNSVAIGYNANADGNLDVGEGNIAIGSNTSAVGHGGNSGYGGVIRIGNTQNFVQLGRLHLNYYLPLFERHKYEVEFAGLTTVGRSPADGFYTGVIDTELKPIQLLSFGEYHIEFVEDSVIFSRVTGTGGNKVVKSSTLTLEEQE